MQGIHWLGFLALVSGKGGVLGARSFVALTSVVGIAVAARGGCVELGSSLDLLLWGYLVLQAVVLAVRRFWWPIAGVWSLGILGG